MFIGQTLTAENAYDNFGSGGIQKLPTVVYSPWFPRQGDEGHFPVDVLSISAIGDNGASAASEPALEVTVEHKDSEEADSAAASGATSEICVVGQLVLTQSGLKELVRLKFNLYDKAATVFIRTYQATFRMLNPSWLTN